MAKIIKVGYIQWAKIIPDEEKYGSADYILDAFENDPDYHIKWCNPMQEECDIVFYDVYNYVNQVYKLLQQVKGNPLKIYSDPFEWPSLERHIDFTSIGSGYSISLYEDNARNCFFLSSVKSIKVSETIWDEHRANYKLDINDINQRKFATFTSSNFECAHRIELVQYLMNHYKHIDSYGAVLNNVNKSLHLDSHHKQFNKYKFSISIENTKTEYNNQKVLNCSYISEKIYDGWTNNSIPIYWGCSDSSKLLFNPKAFIDLSDCDTFEQMIEKIKEVDNNAQLYKDMFFEFPFLSRHIYTQYYSKLKTFIIKSLNEWRRKH